MLVYSILSTLSFLYQSHKMDSTNDKVDLRAEIKSRLPTPVEVKAEKAEERPKKKEKNRERKASVETIEKAELLPEKTTSVKTIEEDGLLPPVNSILPTNTVEKMVPAVIQSKTGFIPETSFKTKQLSRPMQSLSSCICVMDDNHRLVEWIAYHYFVMKLRYLVILPDPKSLIWPKSILDKWRKHMTIVEWKDGDYMTEEQYAFSLKFRNMKDPSKKVAQDHHNMRQNEFLRKCALHMKENDRTWVSFTDVDEYYVINHELIKNSSGLMKEPSSGLKVLHDMNVHLESLHRMTNITITDRFIGPCITTYRSLFGAMESTDVAIRRDVPSFLDPRRFETLRWRLHKSPKIKAQDGKAMLDVSRIPVSTLESNSSFVRPHALLAECPSIFYHDKAFIRINHYLGNWEYYTFRANDPRQGAKKNRRMWEEQMQQKVKDNGDEIRPWISGFVRYFGEEEAKHLLDGCGLDPDFTAPIDDSWKLPRDRGTSKQKKKD
jgi:hypothetical protein